MCEIKHDRFIEAIDRHIMPADAGHYYTEKHFSKYMRGLPRNRFPGLRVEEYQYDGSDLRFSINESIARRLFR